MLSTTFFIIVVFRFHVDELITTNLLLLMKNYMAKRIHMLLTFDLPTFVLFLFTINF